MQVELPSYIQPVQAAIPTASQSAADTDTSDNPKAVTNNSMQSDPGMAAVPDQPKPQSNSQGTAALPTLTTCSQLMSPQLMVTYASDKEFPDSNMALAEDHIHTAGTTTSSHEQRQDAQMSLEDDMQVCTSLKQQDQWFFGMFKARGSIRIIAQQCKDTPHIPWIQTAFLTEVCRRPSNKHKL